LRNIPSPSIRSGTTDGGSVGLPSTSTRCSPTRRRAIALARATASPAAGAETMRLAAVRIPSRWPCSTASLTSGAAPKSSAVTISCLAVRTSGRVRAALPKELEELHALAQAALHHVGGAHHLADDGRDLAGPEIELPIK